MGFESLELPRGWDFYTGCQSLGTNHEPNTAKFGDTGLDPRIYLNALVHRLQGDKVGLGSVSRGYFSAWEGQETALFKRLAAGRGHQAQALHMARQALTSQDLERINDAAVICLDLAIEGTARRALEPRSTGGKRRGEALQLAAKTAWAHYVKSFTEQGCTGKARIAVVAAMRRDSFKLPSTGGFPDRRSIRKWLPIRKVEGS